MRVGWVGIAAAALLAVACKGEPEPLEADVARAQVQEPTPDTAAESDQSNMGFLTVTSSEPVAVFVDGVDFGYRTPARRVPIIEGRHQVQARFDGMAGLSEPREISVRAGQSTSVYFERPTAVGTGEGTAGGTGSGSSGGTGEGTGQASPR